MQNCHAFCVLTCTRLQRFTSVMPCALSVLLTVTHATAALAHAQLPEVLGRVPPDMRGASMFETMAHLYASGRRRAKLSQGGYPTPRSLEALRLEDPAAMSSCWNPGCAPAPAHAGSATPLTCACTCTETHAGLMSLRYIDMLTLIICGLLHDQASCHKRLQI